jgi:hypothetical protein
LIIYQEVIGVFTETITFDKEMYILGDIIALGIWIALYCYRRDLRLRMLIMSGTLLPLAPLGESYFIADYWRPPQFINLSYGNMPLGDVTDFPFVIAIAGFATAIYPTLMQRRPSTLVHPRRLWLIVPCLVIIYQGMTFLTNDHGVNSIFASSLCFTLIAALLITFRRDLWSVALISAAATGLALVTGEALLSLIAPLYLSRYWLLYHSHWNLLLFGHLPFTEALWGAAFGLAVGPLYDVCAGNALVPLDSDPAKVSFIEESAI